MIIAVLVPLIIAMYFYVAMASQAGPSAPLNMF
jgi:hypothetical protein